MGLINRNTASSHLYSGTTFSAPTVVETGDVEVFIKETVAPGATVVFGAAFNVSEMQAMSGWTDNGDTLITDGTDTFVAAGTYRRLWTVTSGEANPFTGPGVVGITVNNSGGAAPANVDIRILLEN